MLESYKIPEFILESYNTYKEIYKTPAKILRFSKKYWRIANEGNEQQTQEWLDFLKKETRLEIDIPFIFYTSLSKGLTEYIPVKCPVCGKLLTIKQVRLNVKHCSEKCRSASPITKEKIRQTYQKKYGVNAPAQVKEIKAKMSATLMKHYGAASPFASEEIRNRARKTLLERYGVDCAFKDAAIREKAKQTNLKRYGVECNLASKECQEKIKKTVREKYGVDYVSQSKDVIETRRQNMLKKYGVSYSFGIKSVQDKTKQTLLMRYGVDHQFKSKEIFDKAKATCKERYGVERPAQNKEILNKIENTRLKKYGSKSFRGSNELEERRKKVMLEKYGVTEVFASKELFNKGITTMQKKYGVSHPCQNIEITNKRVRTLRENAYDKIVNRTKKRDYIILSTKDDYVYGGFFKLKCNKCNTEWIADVKGIRCCPHCAKQHITSEAEKELLFFIKSIYTGNIIENTKSLINPYELDIYIPEKKLAFEFNGTYWHSDKFKDKNYHITKTRLCNKKKVRLIHIFEHEWTFNQEKIKSLIKSALGIFDVRLYARQCEVKEISHPEYKKFLELYHLQNSVNSSIRYGLFYKDELVSVIGFGKSRFKKGEVELHRYCVKAGYQIVGGFSKLIKHACKDASISEFISYIDLAHFSGRGYKKAGFKLVEVTSPSYIYIRGDEIKSRMQCQKHKLEAFLESFDPAKSEYENMLLNDWDRVYDCGNLKVKYTL